MTNLLAKSNSVTRKLDNMQLQRIRQMEWTDVPEVARCPVHPVTSGSSALVCLVLEPGNLLMGLHIVLSLSTLKHLLSLITSWAPLTLGSLDS